MNLRNYLFLFVFAFTGIMFFSCKTEECTCRAIKEVEYRTTADDEGTIIRLSNVASDLIPDEDSGIYVIAPDGLTIVGYYDNNCNKLSVEPASGIFCVEYSNGKMVKILK